MIYEWAKKLVLEWFHLFDPKPGAEKVYIFTPDMMKSLFGIETVANVTVTLKYQKQSAKVFTPAEIIIGVTEYA